MKKNILNILTIIILVSSSLSSCVGKHEGYASEALFELSVDKDIMQTGVTATFTLMNNDILVKIEDAKIQYTDPTGAKKELESNKFSSDVPGKYVFKAVLSADKLESEAVEVVVKSPKPEKLYMNKANILYFTGDWCPNCPAAAHLVKDLQHEFPNQIVPMAIHQNDDYVTKENHETKIDNYFSISGRPSLVVNFNKLTKNEGKSPVIMKKYISDALKASATCGISINTSISDKSISADVNVKFVQDDSYKITVAVLEDYIIGNQVGDPKGAAGHYPHMWVPRAFLTDTFGDDLEAKKSGDDFVKTYKLTANDAWELSRLKVIVLVSVKNGSDYIVTNANDCYVGDNAPFLYELE